MTWRDRNWMKVEGSDVRFEYKSKQVMHEDGYHYHYEDDHSQPPTKRFITPTIVELLPDGQITAWSANIWGCIGHSGTPKPEVKLVPLKGKRDEKALESLIASLERGDRSQEAMFNVMKAARDIEAAR